MSTGKMQFMFAAAVEGYEVNMTHQNSAHNPLYQDIDRPEDFTAFWDETLQHLARVPARIQQEQIRRHGAINHSVVQFQSLDHVTIRGYLLHWDDNEKRPLVVYTHGYNGECDVLWAWARAGFNILGFDTRGFGQSPVERHESWILTGIESPGSSIIRGALCDYIRAVDVARETCSQGTSRTLAYGYSFGGAMALMSQALAPVADMVTAGVPSFGWMAGRRRLVEKGSGFEVNQYLHANPLQELPVMNTLSYFDTANFAESIRQPTLIGIGMNDIVVPPDTVFAISNRLACPHRVMTFPFSHSDHEDERLWKEFEQAWQAMIVSGELPGPQ